MSNLKSQTTINKGHFSASLERFIIRIFKYLFVRHLAVCSFVALSDCELSPDKMLFKWQKMPAGYRWF